MKKIVSVVGARPQFIKHAPMQLQLQQHFEAITLHTGQHYDDNMSRVFFEELNIPKPDYLFSGQGYTSQTTQTAAMMTDIESVLVKESPQGVLVYGDTNSTLAATLVAVKMHIPIIHIEAGLRSYNREMPEEVNRIIADHFAKLLFCPSNASMDNLFQEGIQHENIFRTGDVMCDMLRLIEPTVTSPQKDPYYFVTIHRPYNTDNVERMVRILSILNKLPISVVFAIHPRTAEKIKQYHIDLAAFTSIQFIEPTGYVESITYQKYAEAVLTDSGGIQKEAYMLGKQCVTLRSETEWIETLEYGWNTLVFDDLERIPTILQQQPKTYFPDMYGNGKAAAEIANLILKHL
jgi:UDP-GlcNAc3NAcA epimerase